MDRKLPMLSVISSDKSPLLSHPLTPFALNLKEGLKSASVTLLLRHLLITNFLTLNLKEIEKICHT